MMSCYAHGIFMLMLKSCKRLSFAIHSCNTKNRINWILFKCCYFLSLSFSIFHFCFARLTNMQNWNTTNWNRYSQWLFPQNDIIEIVATVANGYNTNRFPILYAAVILISLILSRNAINKYFLYLFEYLFIWISFEFVHKNSNNWKIFNTK